MDNTLMGQYVQERAQDVLLRSLCSPDFNNKVAACIDRAVRKLSFPTSEKLDVVKQSF